MKIIFLSVLMLSILLAAHHGGPKRAV